MKRIALVAGFALLFVACPHLHAGQITLEPTPKDLYDLPHQHYYTWGMDLDAVVSDPGQVQINGAQLKFDDLKDWTWETNRLYVHLLDTAPLGVTELTDNQGGGDNFAGEGTRLVTYYNLPPIAFDYTYTFSASEVAALNNYLHNDGVFGIGIDPDCHFSNHGVSLKLCYGAIPEPGCLVLMLAGGTLALLRRIRRN